MIKRVTDKLVSNILHQIRLESEQEEHLQSERGIYRASGVGGCPRALQYATMDGVTPEKHSPEFQLFLRDGDTHEKALTAILSKIGTVTHNQRNLQKRYKHKGVSFIVTGTPDGMFNGIIYDVKAINGFSFQALDKNYPEQYMKYVEQMHIYMDILGKTESILIFKDRNWSTIKVKRVEFNPDFMEKLLDKLAFITKAVKKGDMIDRPYAVKSKECKRCPFRMACWKLPMETMRWAS